VDNFQYWKNYFDYFAEKIRCKLIEFGIHYSRDTFRVVGFYDDTVLATSRPGSGPNKNGLRKSNYIQMAFYNGWKKHHGIKFQTLEFQMACVVTSMVHAHLKLMIVTYCVILNLISDWQHFSKVILLSTVASLYKVHPTRYGSLLFLCPLCKNHKSENFPQFLPYTNCTNYTPCDYVQSISFTNYSTLTLTDKVPSSNNGII
jgi:hypothetical protein